MNFSLNFSWKHFYHSLVLDAGDGQVFVSPPSELEISLILPDDIVSDLYFTIEALYYS